MEIEVLKIGGQWKVQFSYGNQFFTLEYGGTKSEANWMAKMLKKCFNNYTLEIKDEKTR